MAFYNCPKTNNHFLNTHGNKIHFKKWECEGDICIFYFHGYNCNINKNIINDFAKELNNIKISMYSIDFQGHGYSEGEKGLILNTNHLVKDYIKFIKLINTKKKIILLGSSMGGAIALETAKYIKNILGCVLLAPAFELTSNKYKFLEKVLDFVSYIFPMSAFPNFLKLKINPENSVICKDFCNWCLEDDMSYKENIKFSTLNAIIKMGRKCRKKFPNCKTIILHDIDDKITDFNASFEFSCSNPKIFLIELKNMKHYLIHNCPNKIIEAIKFHFL